MKIVKHIANWGGDWPKIKISQYFNACFGGVK